MKKKNKIKRKISNKKNRQNGFFFGKQTTPYTYTEHTYCINMEKGHS